MTNSWLKELSSEYIALRAKSINGSWISWGNIRKRFSLFTKTRNAAYLELQNYDYDFSFDVEVWLGSKINELGLSNKELEQGIRALKQHISRAGERFGFLVSFASVYAMLVIFIKADIIPFPEASLVSLSMLALLVLEERTKHLNSKHSLEELVVYLEAIVDERNT